MNDQNHESEVTARVFPGGAPGLYEKKNDMIKISRKEIGKVLSFRDAF